MTPSEILSALTRWITGPAPSRLPPEAAQLTAFWPSALQRQRDNAMRDMAVRHARERAQMTAWRIEIEHRLRYGKDEEEG